MIADLDTDVAIELPRIFCWTKFGAEAGEDVAAILARKDSERESNHGVFLWGIGNAIGPSVELLLEQTAQPQVVFTPILSKANNRDVDPSRVAVWRGGVGLDGRPYSVPAAARVTSRFTEGRAHYALVCRSDAPLVPRSGCRASFTANDVVNLRSGAQVGSSQVTSVVRRASRVPTAPARYRVAFTAELAAPYLVRLTEFAWVEPLG